MGIGAYAAGMYQFLLHAFFKALLFLAAGNVIHAVHDEQDIREMGGLGLPDAGHRLELPGRLAGPGRLPLCRACSPRRTCSASA